jgi:hypothetical protein
MPLQGNYAPIYGMVTDVMTKKESFTLSTTMNGFWIRCQAVTGKINVTIPVGLPDNFTCVLFHEGTLIVEIVPASGVTANSVGGFKQVTAQFGEAGIFCYAPNTFKLTGNLA